jgi:hypothetical protein
MPIDTTLVTRALPVSALALIFAAACSSATPDDTDSTSSAAGGTAQKLIDHNVQAFKPVPSVPGIVYVQSLDGTLRRHLLNSTTPPTWIDANVRAFQPIDGNVIYVLHNDGQLWREGGTATPTLVVSGVSGFQVAADGTNDVYYVDAASTLYLIAGAQPPKVIAYTVRGFQWFPGTALTTPGIYVLRSDGNLWRGVADYFHHSTAPIETNVSSFRAIDFNTYLLEQNDTNLWLEYDTNGVAPNTRGARILLDTKAEFFWPYDGATTFVEDNSFTLWRDEYGAAHRDRVDGNVKAFQPVGRDGVYVLRFDSTLYYESLPNPRCNYRFSTPPHPQLHTKINNFSYVAAWGVDTYSNTCPNLQGANGYWRNWTGGDITNVSLTGITATQPPTCAGLGLTPRCCLYVWEPATTTAVQDPSVLCTPDTAQMNAWIDEGVLIPAGLSGPSPNGGGCGTCGSW